ncbi:hypothetical protein GF377_00835 [candidate division GN15 bacterium]|nr:hypothetical protein [candidate division GN15 bacterium]
MATMDTVPLLINVGVTSMMTGIIWFVQVVHYPLFAVIDPTGFAVYERGHTRLTGYVVAPLMIIELVAAAWLVLSNTAEAWVALGLAVSLWIITFTVHVPLHRALSSTHEPRLIRKLVATNWLRTILWTTRSGLLLLMLAGAFSDPA